VSCRDKAPTEELMKEQSTTALAGLEDRRTRDPFQTQISSSSSSSSLLEKDEEV
jgi:hypothetical protein